MVYTGTFETYLSNFKAALIFILLLVFLVPFHYLGGSFLSSSTLSLDYNLFSLNPITLISLLIILFLFLFFYSLFVVVVNATVKHEFSRIKINEYLNEKMQSLAFALFVAYAAFTILALVLGALLLAAGMPVIVLNILWFFLFLVILFLPQVLVVDDETLIVSIKKSLEFVQTNPKALLTVLFAGVVLVAILTLLEYFVDSYFFYGNYLTLIISLVFVVPYLETLKTIIYLHRYDLIRHSYRTHHRH